MPVTQRVQAPGDWSLSLDGGRLPTPRQITDMIAVEQYGFSHLVITPAHVDPAAFTATSLFEASRYTGRYIAQEDRTELSGDHVTAWLGDADGKGPLLTGEYAATGTLSAWVSDVAGSVTAVPTGSVPAGGATLSWTRPSGMTPRDSLDYLAYNFGVEWRVRNSLLLDVGTITALYGAGNAVRAIATPYWDGADQGLVALRSRIRVTRSLERYAAAVSAFNGAAAVTVNDPTLTYFDGFGDPLWLRKYIEDKSIAGTTELTTLATAHGGADFSWRDMLRVETDSFCPLKDITPGDIIKIWDPDNRIWQLQNEYAALVLDGPAETHYAGQICWPFLTRIYGITMQIRDGMGVYLVRGVDGEIVDLTDYVRWETGMSTLEVGTDPRRLSAAVRRTGVGK